MADIVERLREYNSIPAVGSKLRIGKAIADAADEIERLRAEVTWHEEEKHRLRAALHKIAEWDLTGTAISALGEKE